MGLMGHRGQWFLPGVLASLSDKVQACVFAIQAHAGTEEPVLEHRIIQGSAPACG